MKKGIKKFLIVLVFLALAISLVYSAPVIKDKLSDYKVEKIGDNYYIYKLVEVTDDVKVNKDKVELEKEKQKIEEEILKSKGLVYDVCMNEVCGKDYIKNGDIACPDECLIQQEEYEYTLKINKENLEKELGVLNEVK